MRQHKVFFPRNLQPIGSEGTMQTQTHKMFIGNGRRSEGGLLQGTIQFQEVCFCEGEWMGQHFLLVPGVRQGREKHKVQPG